MYRVCLYTEVLSIVLLLSLKLQIKKQLLNFCQDAGVGWCNAGGRRGEWSLQWYSSTSHPTPDTGMQRGITGTCMVPPLKILVEVTRSRSATPWGMSQPCLNLPLWGKKSNSIIFTMSCREWPLPMILGTVMRL